MQQQQQRDIPSLQTLCVRSITPKTCLSLTTTTSSESEPSPSPLPNKKQETIKLLLHALSQRPSKPYIIPKQIGSNHIDITSPWITTVMNNNNTKNENSVHNQKKRHDNNNKELVIENSNGALDLLQILLDTFIDIGQCDNRQLFSIDFFNHWISCINKDNDNRISSKGITNNNNKRRKVNSNNNMLNNNLLSMSFHNASIGSSRCVTTMLESNIGKYMGVLDFTGVLSLTDELLESIIQQCEHLQRLCLKNCRRLTGISMKFIETSKLYNLKSIDVGGCINILPKEMISLVTNHNNKKKSSITKKTIVEIHVSGLNWNDKSLSKLMQPYNNSDNNNNLSKKVTELKGLSIGFSHYISANGILQTIPASIEILSIPFIECVTDETLEELGRTCCNLRVLDIRGCSLVTTISPLLEYLNSDNLFVLARYTNITDISIHASKNLYPNIALECVIDSSGQGRGIIRTNDNH